MQAQSLKKIAFFGFNSLCVLGIKVLLTSLLVHFNMAASLSYLLTHVVILFVSYAIHLKLTFKQKHSATRFWLFVRSVLFVKALDYIIFIVLIKNVQGDVSVLVIVSTACVWFLRFFAIKKALTK